MPDVVLRPASSVSTDVRTSSATGWTWDVSLLPLNGSNDTRMTRRVYQPAAQSGQQSSVYGNLDVTLGAVLLNSGSILLVSGNMTKTLDAATLASIGKNLAGGHLERVLGSATLQAHGEVITGAITASLNTWLGMATLSAYGTVNGNEPEPEPEPERYIGRQRARQRSAWFIMPLLDKQAHNEHDDEDTLLLL